MTHNYSRKAWQPHANINRNTGITNMSNEKLEAGLTSHLTQELGRKVMVINSSLDYRCNDEYPYPPIGAIGEIVGCFDDLDECDVLFEKYPHPAVGDPSWITHKSMIIFIDDFKMANEVLEHAVA